MFRLLIPLFFLWMLFDIINVVFVGQLTAHNRADEGTKKKWFLFAVLGGPIFTVIAFLLYFMHSSEKSYEDNAKKERLEQEKKFYEDIFEDN